VCVCVVDCSLYVTYKRTVSQLMNAVLYDTQTTACLVKRQSVQLHILNGYWCKVWGGWFETGVRSVLGAGGWRRQCSIGTCVSQDVILLDISCMCLLVGVCMKSKEIICGEEISDFLLVRAVVGDDSRFVFVSMYNSSVVLTSLIV